MARKLRVEYSGAVYHVMNRRDRCEAIFKDDKDRKRFLETLGEACVKTSWQVHALCLMGSEERRAAETGADYKAIRRGWCFGEKAFRQELLEHMRERMGAEHCGEERLETSEAKAQRMIGAELKRRKWNEAQRVKRAKGDLGKVAIAAREREETVVTVAWIAARLKMGTAGYVNNRLYRWRKGMLRK